ncbi:hypothetical protein BGZ76_004220, partial [Entomortierella beljakovae]
MDPFNNNDDNNYNDDDNDNGGDNDNHHLSAIDWYNSTIRRKEEVGFPGFVHVFNYRSEQDADQAYISLISSNMIPLKMQTMLASQYEIWLRNNGAEFWAKRNLSSQISITTKRTATEVVSETEHVSKKFIQATTARTKTSGHAGLSSKAMPSLQVPRKPSRLASMIPLKPQSVKEEKSSPVLSSSSLSSTLLSSREQLSYHTNKDHALDKTSAGNLSSATSASETGLSANFSLASSTLTNSSSASSTLTNFLLASSTLTNSSPISSSASAPSASPKGKKSFTNKNRRSLDGRYQNLGEKWILESGTIVEDVLYAAGSDENCAVFSPIHSFMIDLDDRKIEALFSKADWKEIISDLPPFQHYGDDADKYIDRCMDVDTKEKLKAVLETRQQDPECKIIHYCLDQWEELLFSESSPFPVAARLGEAWWKENAWGVCRRLTTAVKDAFIIMGEKAGHDSTERRNQDIDNADRKKTGVKVDFLWRTISSPDVDWSAGESATVWDPASMKYRNEGSFKLPRQLHDILVARTSEVGGVDSLRKEYVCGLLTGGPVIQRVQICWGTKGKNITRYFRSPERRLFSTVQELCMSVLAIHDLLVLRATTLRLCCTYETCRRQLAKEQ